MPAPDVGTIAEGEREAKRMKAAVDGEAEAGASVAATAAGDSGEWDASVSLESLRRGIGGFARERDWEQFQTPRNLLLALVGEVGEVSEIFQWKGEVDSKLSSFTEFEKVHLGEELSDVLFYLLRLSDVCGIDLGKAAGLKLEKNHRKYPVAKSKGRSTKYDKL